MDEPVRLKDLEFSTRVNTTLQNLGVYTIDDICRFTEDQLMQEPNFGRKSLAEIKDVLAMYDRELGDVPQIDLEKVVAGLNDDQIAELWHKARENIDTMEKQLKKSAPYVTATAIIAKIDEIATKRLDDRGASSISTPHGTIHTVGKTTARIMDQEEFRSFLDSVPDKWAYVDLKANMTACRNRIEEEKAPVPGVELTTYRRLSITAPKAPMKRLNNVE